MRLIEKDYEIDIYPVDNLIRLRRDYRLGRGLYNSEVTFGGTKLDRRNHPLRRQSLYFNELKDFDKMVVL
jgi:hypothetical protein